jgi:hypothetical protein
MRSYNFWRFVFNKVTSRSTITSSNVHPFLGREMDSSK